jgi:hypothetical protein
VSLQPQPERLSGSQRLGWILLRSTKQSILNEEKPADHLESQLFSCKFLLKSVLFSLRGALNSDPCQPVREVLTNAVKLVFICMYVYYDYYVNFDWGRRSDPPGGADAFLAKNTPSSPHSASYTVLFSGQRVAVLEGFGGREWQGVKRCGSVFCARGADTEPQHVGFGGLWRALVVWRAVVALCRGGAERVEWVERVAGERDVRRAVVELQLELACVCLVR